MNKKFETTEQMYRRLLGESNFESLKWTTKEEEECNAVLVDLEKDYDYNSEKDVYTPKQASIADLF